MKAKQTLNAVRSVEIRCKKTTNAVPAVGEISDSLTAAQFARQFYSNGNRLDTGRRLPHF